MEMPGYGLSMFRWVKRIINKCPELFNPFPELRTGQDSILRGDSIMAEYDLDKLGQALMDSPEVAAAYIFGSAVAGEPVVNDLDILVLPYPGVDRNTTYFELYDRIAKSQNAYGNQIDILFFDLDEADPEVLYDAVNKGTLIKNACPDLLAEKIETLTRYFVVNEFILKQAKLFDQERLEAFCEDQ